VALIADGLGGMHGVTHTVQQIRERGVPGYEVEVIGTDSDVDRRLSAVAEIDIPFYPGLQVGVPSLPAIVETLAEGRYDLLHLTSPGPSGIGAWLVARVLELPVIGSYHTELAAYAGLRSGAASLQAIAGAALGAFYGACDVVLSPSPASDERLAELGIASPRVGRWDRGVDLDRFDPRLRDADMFGGKVNVLYCGRLTREKGVDLLADAFLRAREEDPRLHLVLAGGGPEEGALRERLGEHGTFLGWLSGSDLPKAYASADAFLFASRTDTFGQVILEAQASGLPVIAVGEGGPTSLIADGESGLLTAPTAEALAGALLSVVRTPALRERLSKTALAIVKERTWGASLRQLAAGYRSALLRGAAPGRARAA
jgi:glycosyltransferase involved in cell wall biosynthesis